VIVPQAPSGVSGTAADRGAADQRRDDALPAPAWPAHSRLLARLLLPAQFVRMRRRLYVPARGEDARRIEVASTESVFTRT
jgi:hypothetical protein